MITNDKIAEMDRALEQFAPGFVFSAKKLRLFYDALCAEGLPEFVIIAELTAYCAGESRLQVEPMIHNFFVQQHQAQEQQEQAKQWQTQQALTSQS